VTSFNSEQFGMEMNKSVTRPFAVFALARFAASILLRHETSEILGYEFITAEQMLSPF
jgi:lipopolysaccharide export LptBFGC system permease protein LptF